MLGRSSDARGVNGRGGGRQLGVHLWRGNKARDVDVTGDQWLVGVAAQELLAQVGAGVQGLVDDMKVIQLAALGIVGLALAKYLGSSGILATWRRLMSSWRWVLGRG